MTVARPGPLPDHSGGPAPRPGEAAVLAPGLVRVTAPNPGFMTGPGTNTYLVGAGELAVVDPGPDNPAHLGAILGAARSRGRIRWIVVTHTHADHAPGAGALARATGAERIGYGPSDGFVPDRRAADGWRLTTASFALRAVHTPGHASNHLCWLLEPDGVLFSGDHVMQGSTVVIAPPDGDMAAYLASLQAVLDLEPPVTAIAPGHGRLLVDPRGAVSAVIAHRRRREALVLACLAERGTAGVDQLLRPVYGDVDEERHPVARLSLWAHLRKLTSEGRAVLLQPEIDELEAARWAAAEAISRPPR